MSDLIDRIKKHIEVNIWDGYPKGGPVNHTYCNELFQEALEEIERLEAVVDAVREYERVDNTNARLNMRRKLAALEVDDE